MLRNGTPCDYSPFECPYSAYTMTQCEYYCGEDVYDIYAEFEKNAVLEDERSTYGLFPGKDVFDEGFPF